MRDYKTEKVGMDLMNKLSDIFPNDLHLLSANYFQSLEWKNKKLIIHKVKLDQDKINKVENLGFKHEFSGINPFTEYRQHTFLIIPKNGKFDIPLNNVYDIHTSMSAYEAPKTTVRDLLTQQEVDQLLQLRSPALIAMWKKSKSANDQSGFCGYYPLNAGVDQNVLTVHRLEDQSLDVLKDFCTGG